jgi:hypothetical protein
MDRLARPGNYRLRFGRHNSHGMNRKNAKQHRPSALEESPAINTRAEQKQVEERLAIGPHYVRNDSARR